jgi:hypothetical protein
MWVVEGKASVMSSWKNRKLLSQKQKEILDHDLSLDEIGFLEKRA